MTRSRKYLIYTRGHDVWEKDTNGELNNAGNGESLNLSSPLLVPRRPRILARRAVFLIPQFDFSTQAANGGTSILLSRGTFSLWRRRGTTPQGPPPEVGCHVAERVHHSTPSLVLAVGSLCEKMSRPRQFSVCMVRSSLPWTKQGRGRWRRLPFFPPQIVLRWMLGRK